MACFSSLVGSLVCTLARKRRASFIIQAFLLVELPYLLGVLQLKEKKDLVLKMMKPMNDNSNNSNNNDSNNNSSWLGFSLSPHRKMEVASSQYHHESQSLPVTVSNSSISTSMFLPLHQLYPHPHPLTVMPIKSDGSLCIMEALSRSQSQGMDPSSPPKLENFLGGATTTLSLDNSSYFRY